VPALQSEEAEKGGVGGGESVVGKFRRSDPAAGLSFLGAGCSGDDPATKEVENDVAVLVRVDHVVEFVSNFHLEV
jgi:hypothetical protein